ncbi:hypothetical protein A2U01_0062701, partial [Trifolium medium]|nr:hypothetical protein [Trifolium medium]
KYSCAGSSNARFPSGPLVEALPFTDRDGGASVRTCIYPPMPLGGARMELDNLRKLIKETTLWEEDVVGRLGASEHQVRILSNRLKDYYNSDLGLLWKDNTKLRSRVDFLESELHAFR